MANVEWNKINMRAKDKNLPPKEGENYLFYSPTRRSYYIGKFVENTKRKGTYFVECEFWDIDIKTGILWMELPAPMVDEV